MTTSTAEAALKLLHQVLVRIRLAAGRKDSELAYELAEAFHELPMMLVRGASLDQRHYEDLYIGDLFERYPSWKLSVETGSPSARSAEGDTPKPETHELEPPRLSRSHSCTGEPAAAAAGRTSDASTDAASSAATTDSETMGGIFTVLASAILAPTKTSTPASPTFR